MPGFGLSVHKMRMYPSTKMPDRRTRGCYFKSFWTGIDLEPKHKESVYNKFNLKVINSTLVLINEVSKKS